MQGGTQAGSLRFLGALLSILAIFCAARGETLTIATYNVENYVAANRRVDEVFRPAYPKPEKAKEALRAVIRGLDADVLALQEMGSTAYLEELRRDLRTEGTDYPHAALADAADADRHLAVLSRVPLKRVQTLADLDFRYLGSREAVKRGVLEITLVVGGRELTLFVVHLRSRYTVRPDDPNSALCRAGEAAAVRDHILRTFPDLGAARFAILGDCNDTRDSRTLRLLTKRGGMVVTVLLDAADSNGETWTYLYRKNETYSRVDHILVSPSLVSAVAGGKARIHDGPGVREASDHRPVSVRLMLAGD